MASLAHTLYDGYNYLTEDLAHPLTKNWFMVDDLWKLIIVLVSYLYFCLNLGPWYMKDKKPYDLKNVMKIYNIFQITISLYLSYEGTALLFFNDFNFRCQGVIEEPNSPLALRIATVIWLYYIVKIIDLLDTIFFVFRKSDRQITQLHLLHHTIMPIGVWISAKYSPGGQCIIVVYINAIVHAVMYIYYLLAGLGDEYKKYLWWKKYLTTLQLIQFVIVGAHSVNSLFYPCSYWLSLKFLTIIYSSVFTFMFGKFYYYNYIKIKNGKMNNGSMNDNKNSESKFNARTSKL